ncbi:MAG: hypothetical protein EA417_04840 [Gammaproteobacteria bacterium]|nr:MAG: hypothetical protein EA417_04840 [Gammaproteobacteria bacterium]
MLKPRFSFSVDRSARYLNWRYFALPGAKPLAIVATDASGTVLGIAVAMERFELDRHRQPAATHLEITEFLLAEDDPELADHLIIFILRHAQELAVDSVGTMPITAFIQSRLKALGFTSEDSTQFSAMLLDKKTQDMPQLIDTEIMYTAGDGDSIYVTGR